MRRYDRPKTFFYLDPPYYLAAHYNHNMELPDFEALASALARLQARFILSINDHPDMRRVFGAFKIQPVNLKYSVARNDATPVTELLISNFSTG